MRKAYNGLKDTVYDYRPFYVPRVYDLAKQLLERLRELHRIVQDSRHFEKMDDRAEELMAEVNDTDVPQLCEAIRMRVFPTSVADEESVKDGNDDDT